MLVNAVRWCTPCAAGAVQFGGHRIAGLSGTYVAQHYHWGHHEKLPYDDRTVKSAYHVRQLHVHRLMQVCVLLFPAGCSACTAMYRQLNCACGVAYSQLNCAVGSVLNSCMCCWADFTTYGSHTAFVIGTVCAKQQHNLLELVHTDGSKRFALLLLPAKS